MEKKQKLIIGGASLAVIALVAGGIALGSRSSGNDTASPSSSTSSSTNAPGTTADTSPKAPLTGLPVSDPSILNRPLLTVKIDNSPDARPQFGIEHADGIVEEKVEGGISRFMALFQSADDDQVGPVRSLRTTDAAWLKPEGGLIAFSGAIDSVEATLPAAGITNLGGDRLSGAYYKRLSGRPYEHSLWVNTTQLRTLTPDTAQPAKALYSYLANGEAFGGSTATPLATVQGQMGAGGTSYAWTWDPSQSKYLRTTDGKSHLIQDVGQIAMDNVILEYVPYRVTQYRDRANSQVDEAVTTGSGDAWLISDGKIVQGKWSRPNDTDITKFTDSTGAEVKLKPGKTWLQLVPDNLKANPIATQ